MTVLGLDHIAVAVRDMDAALERYRRLFGKVPCERLDVPDQQVEVTFLQVGGSQLELIRPLSSESPVARFLAKRGEGLHHIALAVDDIREEMQRLVGEGAELVDREPKRGAHGLVAFLHPRSMDGVLVELVQAERRDAPVTSE